MKINLFNTKQEITYPWRYVRPVQKHMLQKALHRANSRAFTLYYYDLELL